MSRPKVSIGMPVFNGGDFLQQALESILAQSFPDFELIVSDNASTDDTSVVVKRFQAHDGRIRYVRQATNIGPIENFNFVLSEAQADYFIWAAADDLWDKDWIETLLANMTDSVAISFGHVCNVDAAGRVVRRYEPLEFKGSAFFRMVKYYLAEDFDGKANVIYGMYHTEAIRNVGMKDAYGGCSFGVDMLFVFGVLQKGDIVSDSATLLYKRAVEVEQTNRSLYDVLFNSLLMLNRVHYNLVYIGQSKTLLMKLVVGFLFPVKYMKAFVFNLVRIVGVIFAKWF